MTCRHGTRHRTARRRKSEKTRKGSSSNRVTDVTTAAFPAPSPACYRATKTRRRYRPRGKARVVGPLEHFRNSGRKTATRLCWNCPAGAGAPLGLDGERQRFGGSRWLRGKGRSFADEEAVGGSASPAAIPRAATPRRARKSLKSAQIRLQSVKNRTHSKRLRQRNANFSRLLD